MSIDTLLNIYRENVDKKKKYKYYLKANIKLKYPDEILFISPEYRIQEDVISRHCLETKTIAESIRYPKKIVIQKTAEKLH